MPVVRSTAIPLADYSGTITMPSSAVPDWVTRVVITVARCTSVSPDLWPDVAVTLAMDAEFSADNGVTWRSLASFTARGGVLADKSGNEATESGFVLTLPAGSGRRLRGVATIDGGVMRTQGFIEVS